MKRSKSCEELLQETEIHGGDTAELMMRTRRWASMRAQTLYRTVKGMMLYEKTLRLLVECESSYLSERFRDKKERDLKINEIVRGSLVTCWQCRGMLK